MPAALPGFVGRQVELAGIQGTLRPAGGTRIVAITGLTGMGKTALAVHAAHNLRDRFPDGQVYANLEISDGGAVDPGAVLGGSCAPSACRRAECPTMPKSGRLCGVPCWTIGGC